MHCRRCDRRLRPRGRKTPSVIDARRPLRATDGSVQHQARGLCAKCHATATIDGTLATYEPLPIYLPGRPRAHVAEDFVFLMEAWSAKRDDTNRFGYTPAARRRAAERLGITVAALEKALDRAAGRAS